MRVSFSFQQETPTSWQIDDTEVLVKLQELSLPFGSESAFFTPWRQSTSSSMEMQRDEKKRKNEAKRIMILFMIGENWGGGLAKS